MTHVRTTDWRLRLAVRATDWSRAVVDRCRDRVRGHGGPADRGDVPGWVLVTLMTAGLVTALWVVAGRELGEVFERAISGVTGP
ncbi:hypothetical protein [Cellulomonas sp. URHB0016]